MIDVHSHILPGLDDGAGTLSESVAMAQAAAEGGIRTIVATPHIREDFEVDIQAIAGRVDALNAVLEDKEIPVRVLPGGELAHSLVGSLAHNDLRAISLAGRSRYVLLEAPYRRAGPAFVASVRVLAGRGFRAVIAHPERSPELADPRRLGLLVAGGALVQITAASLLGALGRRTRHLALELVRQRLVHVVASDAHHVGLRPSSISEAVQLIGVDEPGLLEALQTMTEDVPRRLLADEDVEAIASRSDIWTRA